MRSWSSSAREAGPSASMRSRRRRSSSSGQRRELTDRLAKVLAREFSFQEIRVLQAFGPEDDALRSEAFEIARNTTKGR
jgi:hypothetical protein